VPRNGRASEEDERRIAAAVATHRIAPARAAFYRSKALSGEDISLLDSLQPDAGNALASSGSHPTPEGDEATYADLFPTAEEDRRRADTALAAAVYNPADDKEVFESLFGKGTYTE